MQEIVREVLSWDYLVDDWIDYHGSSALVHLYYQVDELFTSHSPSTVNSRTLMKSKARKTMWRLFMQTILSPTCLLGESLSTLALIVDSGAPVCISPCREDFVTYKPSKVKIKDLSKLNKVDGEGLIRWKVRDKLGNNVVLELPGYHIPNARVCLLGQQVQLTTVGEIGRAHV